METVDHDGRTTAYRLAGTGDEPTVLYVHGSGATHRVWGAQYGPDGPVRPAVAVDLSGHGESDDVDTDPGLPTLDAYVADVAAVAEATDADVLVGNSLGGAVVLQSVLDGRTEPSALVLAGSGAKLAVSEPIRELLANDFERAIDVLHGENLLFHEGEGERLERSKAEMREVGQRVTRRDFLTCHTFDVRDRLDEIAVPTLAICGEHDELTPPWYHEFLAENVEHARSATIPGAAHLAMLERPDAFNEELASFLESKGRL